MHTAISYSKTLQLPTSILSQEFMGTCCEYALSSIVLHHGKLATGGHYTAVCLDRHADKVYIWEILYVETYGNVVVSLRWRCGGSGLGKVGVKSFVRNLCVSICSKWYNKIIRILCFLDKRVKQQDTCVKVDYLRWYWYLPLLHFMTRYCIYNT